MFKKNLGWVGICFVFVFSSQAFAGDESSTTSAETKVIQKKVDDMLIASVRYQGKYEDMGAYIGTLMSAAGKLISGPMFSLYYDDGTGDVHDIEVCVPVSDSVKAEGITTRLLEGGQMLILTHTGPYEGLVGAWGELYKYIGANKIETGMPVREIYLAWDEKDPSKNVTELAVPLVEKTEK